jgi:hypothetical protein
MTSWWVGLRLFMVNDDEKTLFETTPLVFSDSKGQEAVQTQGAQS